MSDIQYAPAVGEKFYEDGSVRQFPGNTVICFADPDGQAYQDAAWVQQEVLKEPFGHQFAMLPPSSFHMTVFELLCDDVRTPKKWSSKLALDTTLIETDDFFIKAFAQVPTPDNFRMKFSHLGLGPIGMSLALLPADNATAVALQDYREALATATGIRFPDHETYGFHLSLAYRIIQLSDEEQLEPFIERINKRLGESFGVFDTGKPTLTFFDDMFAFVPVEERLTLQSRTTDT